MSAGMMTGDTRDGCAMGETGIRLYDELASWFHLLTAPEDYEEEATFYLGLLTEALGEPPRLLLELGSGGGNMASWYKRQVAATLTDIAPGMLELSRQINPELEHIQGDMRTLRLGRTFDAVLVHDAVCYMLTEEDLRRAIVTAWLHLRPGGAAVFAPDHTREAFKESTDHGGHDGDGRALRYLAWTHDPDPTDTRYTVEYAYILHEDGQPARTVGDQHEEGLFGREVWLRLLAEAGFVAHGRFLEHSEVPLGDVEVFVAVKPERRGSR